jgi:hypothetical protein
VQVTAVLPQKKNDPDGGEQFTVNTPLLSLAMGSG